MISVCLAMNTIKSKALQLFTQVIQVFEALASVVIMVLNTSTKVTEHRGTTSCLAVIQVFEALQLSIVKVLNRSTKGGEGRDGKFSNLPDLVLWKIMDRLDFPDSLRIASVSNGWRSAALSYTKDIRFRGQSPPWIMVRSVQGSSATNFSNISTGMTYTIINQEFCQAGSTTLFSKQGWFLLHTKLDEDGFYTDQNGIMGNVFLLNPFTNKKIELPLRSIYKDRCSTKNIKYLRSIYSDRCSGAFTIKDGKPDLVVVIAGRPCCAFGCIRLWTIRVGQKNLWATHTYKCSDGISTRRVEIIGQHIFIIGGTKAFLIFSLSSCHWIPVKQSLSGSTHAYIVQTDEGEFWKIHMPDPTFHRLSIKGWEEVKVKEHKHICCFVKLGSVDYLVSKFVARDVDDAFSGFMRESHLFERKIIEYQNDANTINRVVMYIIREKIGVKWVDMP